MYGVLSVPKIYIYRPILKCNDACNYMRAQNNSIITTPKLRARMELDVGALVPLHYYNNVPIYIAPRPSLLSRE